MRGARAGERRPTLTLPAVPAIVSPAENTYRHSPVAQSAEHSAVNRRVGVHPRPPRVAEGDRGGFGVFAVSDLVLTLPPVPAIVPSAEKPYRHSPVAQSAEHSAVNRRVAGSSPARGAIWKAGRLPSRRWPFHQPSRVRPRARTCSQLRRPADCRPAASRVPKGSSAVQAGTAAPGAYAGQRAGRGCPRRGERRGRLEARQARAIGTFGGAEACLAPTPTCCPLRRDCHRDRLLFLHRRRCRSKPR